MTIYKSFLRPQIHHGDIIFDKAYAKSFKQKLEYIQCDATLAIIIGPTRESSIEKLFLELGLESLRLQKWSKTLFILYEVTKIYDFLFIQLDG